MWRIHCLPVNQLIERLPANLNEVSKLKFLSPRFVLAKIGRPKSQQLPIEFLDHKIDKDLLENQWLELGMTCIPDICHYSELHEKIETMDTNHFWECVYNCKIARNDQPFKELACFALTALTLPISNAVVERVFSVLSCIKTRHRNKFQLLMLESLIRIRVHLKVKKRCCKDFIPTKYMLDRFTAKIYLKYQEIENSELNRNFDITEDLEDQDYEAISTLFNTDDSKCQFLNL